MFLNDVVLCSAGSDSSRGRYCSLEASLSTGDNSIYIRALETIAQPQQYCEGENIVSQLFSAQ
jgi:hypothetical protein